MSADTSVILKRELPSGDWVVLRRMLLGNVRLSLCDRDPDDVSCFHSPNYCYHNVGRAILAVQEWDGEGDPEGWVRHIESGRRRPDGDASQEYVNP